MTPTKPPARCGDWLRPPFRRIDAQVEAFMRFHHDRTGRWVHPHDLGEPEVEAFLTHLAVNRRVARSTQDQALGAILFLSRHVLLQDLNSLGTVRANRPKRLVVSQFESP